LHRFAAIRRFQRAVGELGVRQRNPMQTKFSIFLILLFTATSVLANPSPKYHSVRELPLDTKNLRSYVIRAWMDKIIYPHVYFREATAAEAVSWVHQKIKSLSPDGRGLSMVFQDAVPPVTTKVNLNIQNATLPEVLDLICRQIDYVWGVEPYSIDLIPRETAHQ
jgi:hypothetical protein